MLIAESVNRSCGFYVLEISENDNNVAAIRTALEHARNHFGQPKFLNIASIIGFGTAVAGTSKAHQMAFGHVDIEKCKNLWGFDNKTTHFVPKDVRQDWKEVRREGQTLVSHWQQTLAPYAEKYPELAQQFQAKVCGDLGKQWRQELDAFEVSSKSLPIRQSSAHVYDTLWKIIPFFGGSADLSEPNFMIKEPKLTFGPPRPGVENVSFTGRYVHYGTREHAMMAIANGMAAYAPQAFVPITATFSMFQLYGASAIRMSALNKVQLIHIGTHDSIAEGACGPTHQVGVLFKAARRLMWSIC
jgi:dihydroxyacetone synthase